MPSSPAHDVARPMYVCDLDGTLLRSDASLSPAARSLLTRIVSEGAQVTVATARSTEAIRALLHGVPLRLPVIELNGAFVTDPATGEHLVEQILASDMAEHLAAELERRSLSPVATTTDGRADHVYYSAALNAGSGVFVAEKQAYGDRRLRPCSDVARVAARERVAVLTAFAPIAELDEHVATLTDLAGRDALVTAGPNPYTPGWAEIGIQHPHATKGVAVGKLLAHLGRSANEVTVCGDAPNDLNMAVAADRFIAPRNADPAVLAVATHVVPSNAEDGVVRFLVRDWETRRAVGGPPAAPGHRLGI